MDNEAGQTAAAADQAAEHTHDRILAEERTEMGTDGLEREIDHQQDQTDESGQGSHYEDRVDETTEESFE